MLCDSCEALFINGVKCHELGCPAAWRDHTPECRLCGCDFKPDSRDQAFCDEECARAYSS